MSEKSKGKITISRPYCGDGREFISIKVQDVKSRTRFLDVEISYSDFAQLLTGLSEVSCDIIPNNLDRVGKEMVMEEVVVEMSEEASYSKPLANQRVLNWIEASEHDWVIFGGFSSQNTFFKKEGINYARTNLRRWV